MSEADKSNIVHTCNFCGATDNDGVTELMIKGQDGTLICNSCVRTCEALLIERDREDIPLYRFIDLIPKSTEVKLRPITRIPKSWVICKVHLQKIRPCVTACSPDGEKFETFSIPRQLAYWMIFPDEEINLDKIRKDIAQDIINAVKKELQRN